MLINTNKKLPSLIPFIIFFVSIAYTQPYAIGKATISFTDASRNNRVIESDIYYPAQQAGTNVSVVAGTQKFPVISIGHGFVMSVDAYANLWNMLVPEGYIVVLPKTEGSFSPSHANFGKDLSFVIDAIQQEGLTNNSRFFNRVDTMNCVMGHSMGGGAAHLAAAGNNKIKTIATLAAANTNPSAITAAGNLTIPSLVFAGTYDCITPPPDHQDPIYNALKSECKTYISINGGSHCQMAESNGNCNGGEFLSGCSTPPITRALQHSIIKSYLIPWLQFQLKKDCNAGINFENLMKTDNKITFNNNCSFCVLSNAQGITLPAESRIYPNPFSENLFLDYGKQATEPVDIKIQGADGKIHLISRFRSGLIKINTSQLPAGSYFLHMTSRKENRIYKIVKSL